MVSIVGNHDGSSAVDYTVNPSTGFPWATGPRHLAVPFNHLLPAWDAITGTLAAAGVLAAERHRARTGEGQLVRIALSDVAFAMVGNLGKIAEAQVLRRERRKDGNYLYGAFGRDFLTSEGRRIMIVALTGRQWQNLVEATGLHEAFETLEKMMDVDLSREGDRFRAREVIGAVLKPWTISHTLRRDRGDLRRPRRLLGPLPDLPRAGRGGSPLLDRQPDVRGGRAAGDRHLPGARARRWTSARSSACVRARAPLLGEHTDEVLSELLGLDDGGDRPAVRAGGRRRAGGSRDGLSWIVDFRDGSREMRDLLGGKGAGIAEMTRVLGADRVPAGFTITTEACVAYLRDGVPPDGLEEEVDEALGRLERAAGKRLGDPRRPAAWSRSARVPASRCRGCSTRCSTWGSATRRSRGLARQTSDPRFAWDSYRRLLQMFGGVVRGLPAGEFEDALDRARAEAGASVDTELDADRLRELCERFKRIIADAGEPFPQDPREQLREAIVAVFESWNGARARSYRRLERIPDDWGTAVNVQRMAFGNRGETSGSGVAFSRNETTGAPEPSGDFLANSQGEDVVAGIRNTEGLDGLRERLPEVHAELLEVLETLERHYGDMQDVEFTVEDGKLFLLQTRAAKRPAQASVRFACDAVDEGLLGRPRRWRRSTPRRSRRSCTRPSTRRTSRPSSRAACPPHRGRPRARSCSRPRRRCARRMPART